MNSGYLAQRLVSTVRHSEKGAARLTEWLREIGGDFAGRELGQLCADRAVADVLGALAEASPYLWELARDDPQRLVELLTSDPDDAFAAALAQASQAAAAEHEAAAMGVLRRMKARAALLIALADLGGVWPVMEVTSRLTRLADAAIGAAADHAVAAARRLGKLVLFDEHSRASGLIVLAMGKMGAGELNYSSDVDLIVFYDPAAQAGRAEPGPLYVGLTRALVRLLQQRTADGYVFRTDLRLRPDPGATQIAISTTAALDYYESRGQNWERAALIKARPCAGDTRAGEALLRALAPFMWRKYLDFAAVADIHAMKRQMHAYRGHEEIAVEGHNIKLGRGGIREIEFFVQTQQLIAGGRHPELRGRQTLETLAALAAGAWIDREARDQLSAAYRFLRSVENRLQMLADEQTHTLPRDREGIERFARFAGFPDRDAFAEALLTHLRNVQRHYANLFENAPAIGAAQRGLRFPSAVDDRETLERLASLGFRQPLEISALVRGWSSDAHPSLKSPFARDQLVEIVPMLIEHLARVANPDGTVIAFDRFLAGLRGGGRLFSLLRRNPDLIALIAQVLGTAPRLAELLALFPEVMDAVVDPGFFGPLPDARALAAALDDSLQQATTEEELLDRVRTFAQERMFLIGVRILSGTVSAEQAGEAFARLADVVIRVVHRAVEENFAQRHGRLGGQENAILALGKLGGREMTASSDLDLIVVYNFDAQRPESDGARPLYGAQYFSRLTQRLIGALTAQTNHGLLYRVDMRLRPSGRAGPLATHVAGFAEYQAEEAWTWEHMALTRARVVSATPEFGGRVEGVIRNVLCRERDRTLVAGDIVEMRNAIASEKGSADRWNLSHAPGGLIDIEFIAQFLQLVHAAETPEILDASTARVLDKAWRLGMLPAEEAEVLRPAVRLYHDLTQILRLCLVGSFDPAAVAPDLLALLRRAADLPDFATLDAFLAETQAKVRKSFERILGVRAG